MPTGSKGADRELNILKNLPSHRNVVTFHKAFEIAQHLYIFLELCDHGNLTEFIEKRGRRNPENKQSILSAIEAQYVVKSIVKGLAFLSKNKIIHRDIKLDNIFVKRKSEY